MTEDYVPATTVREETAAEQRGEGWEGHVTCPACPLQAQGIVDGRPWYFRARYDRWEFGVAPEGGTWQDAVAATWGGEGFTRSEAYGAPRGYAASWMDLSDAWRFVADCIARFRTQTTLVAALAAKRQASEDNKP